MPCWGATVATAPPTITGTSRTSGAVLTGAIGTNKSELLAARGVRPISYADWPKIETAEKELAASLGRGARVELASRAAIRHVCRLRNP
jgi:hypothetical protein